MDTALTQTDKRQITLDAKKLCAQIEPAKEIEPLRPLYALLSSAISLKSYEAMRAALAFSANVDTFSRWHPDAFQAPWSAEEEADLRRQCQALADIFQPCVTPTRSTPSMRRLATLFGDPLVSGSVPAMRAALHRWNTYSKNTRRTHLATARWAVELYERERMRDEEKRLQLPVNVIPMPTHRRSGKLTDAEKASLRARIGQAQSEEMRGD